MSISHFEKLIDDEIAKCATAALDCTLGDSLVHAKIKGQSLGLKLAKDLYRKASRTDIVDPDDTRKEAA